MNNPDIQAQSPLKTYTSIDVYYEAHEAVLAAKKAWELDNNPITLKALHSAMVKRVHIAAELSPSDFKEIVQKFFTEPTTLTKERR